MGIKRPFEEGDFPETCFRQPKQRDYPRKLALKLALNAEEYHIATLAVQYPGVAKNMFYQMHFEQFEDCDTNNAYVPDKELEASAPLCLVTSSSSKEDVVIEGTSDWSCFPRGDSHQNRSYPSSDIEDHQGLKGEFYLVEGEGEDSMVESFSDQND